MEIIYVSLLTSKSKMNKIIETAKEKPMQSIQKFHRLMCEGFAENNLKVRTISSIPMSRKILKKVFWCEKKEVENGVEYNYIPFINIKFIKQICIFIGTILSVIKECFHNKKEKIFICDVLNTTVSATTLILSKIFNFRCVGLVTDLPRDISVSSKFSKWINEKLQTKYDGYILLTEAMSEVVNPKNKQYVIIEGLADDTNIRKNSEEKYEKKVCMYAGGLYEKYGVKSLIDAFKQIEGKDYELHLYGMGDLEEYIKNIEDDRIKYFGVVTNDVIVAEEYKVTLLVNPRFTNEEYTKYSFPSKNIEYMTSGTPVLTTKLPGMPKDYYEHVYFIEEETADGIKNALENVLNIETEELMEKGLGAREFMLKNKNQKAQTKKIIDSGVLG